MRRRAKKKSGLTSDDASAATNVQEKRKRGELREQVRRPKGEESRVHANVPPALPGFR